MIMTKLLILKIIISIIHYNWVPSCQGMASPHFGDERDGRQIWRVAANILNKKLRTADKGWPSSLEAAGC
jgi:hypothetical protein